MSKSFNPYEQLPQWSEQQRQRYCEEPNVRKIRIDLSDGGPHYTPYSPAVKTAKYAMSRPDIMNTYYSTGSSYTSAGYLNYLKPFGIQSEKPLTKDNITVGNGGTQLYAAATQSLLKPDDVLLVPVPTYGYFLKLAYLGKTTIRPLPLDPKNGFKLTPEQLDREITRINKELAHSSPGKKVTAFLNINPHNPSGTVYDREEIEALATILKKHDIHLVIDDMVYSGLEYGQYKQTGGRIAAPMAGAEGMFDKTVTLLGLSKSYSLTGLRAGLAVGPEHFIKPMREYIGHNAEFISMPAQAAMTSVFSNEQTDKNKRSRYLSDQAKQFTRKYMLLKCLVEGIDDSAWLEAIIHSLSPALKEFATPEQAAKWQESEIQWQNMLKEQLSAGLPGVKFLPGVEAGFFQLLDISGLKGKYYGKKRLNNSSDFMEALRKESGVNVLPGEAMGYYGDHMLIRISFSINPWKLTEGIIGIRHLIEKIKDKPYTLQPKTVIRSLNANVTETDVTDTWKDRIAKGDLPREIVK